MRLARAWRTALPSSLSGLACECTMGTAAWPWHPLKKAPHTLLKRGRSPRVRKPTAIVISVVAGCAEEKLVAADGDDEGSESLSGSVRPRPASFFSATFATFAAASCSSEHGMPKHTGGSTW